MIEIPRTPIEDNPRLEAMAMEVMTVLQKHTADIGEALDLFTNLLVGTVVQYPKGQMRDSVIDLIVQVLREGSLASEDELIDYTVRLRGKTH